MVLRSSAFFCTEALLQASSATEFPPNLQLSWFSPACMRTSLIKGLKWILLSLAIVLSLALALRAYDARRGSALSPWHTVVPAELTTDGIDAAEWDTYLQRESQIFRQIRKEVMQRSAPGVPPPVNRYFEGSIVDPAKFGRDWNRSYVLEPPGRPMGAVVLLHGLTDSPYSLRRIGQIYVDHGFVAVGIRLPGHGTVPAGLTDITWEAWAAATRLAVREARRRAGPDVPLHLVGFSNGGALAMKYALDALEQPGLARPSRIVMISPMIGITRFARIAGFAELPALLPAFARSAWLDVVPEFNPFKYNSFPVNGARQSHRLTVALQRQIVRLSGASVMASLPPVLTFQSVTDHTVSTPAVLSALYAYLPANGSELVLFDINRAAKIGGLLSTASSQALTRLMPPLPELYRLTIIANSAAPDGSVEERAIEPGAVAQSVRTLDLIYPPQIFSISHVAIPFPVDDPLYGIAPTPGAPEYGISLGAITARGERGTLIINFDSLSRIASNPFFPYVVARIEQGIATLPGQSQALEKEVKAAAEANAMHERTPEPAFPAEFDSGLETDLRP
jgi:alpha-beta hydrolase superfamily lysophospholipase